MMTTALRLYFLENLYALALTAFIKFVVHGVGKLGQKVQSLMLTQGDLYIWPNFATMPS